MFLHCNDIRLCHRDGDVDYVLDLISPRFDTGGDGPVRPVGQGQQAAIVEAVERMRSGQWQFIAEPCPCGGRGFRVISLRDRFGLPSPVSACRVCGLLQNSPRLSDDACVDFYANFYRRIYMGWEPNTLFEDQRVRGARLLRWLKRHGSAPAAGDLVLEIGTGAGGILSVFAEEGCRVAGCDFDPRFLAFGRNQGLDLRQGDAANLQGPAQLVIMSHVFEHVTNPLEELGRVRNLLSPAGKLMLQVPGISHEIQRCHAGGHRLFDFLDYLQNAHNFHFWGPDLHWMARAAKFEVVAGDDEVTVLLAPADEAMQGAPDWCPRMDGDPSLYQLKKLRRLEMTRRMVGRPAQALCAASHQLRAVVRSALRGKWVTPGRGEGEPL